MYGPDPISEMFSFAFPDPHFYKAFEFVVNI